MNKTEITCLVRDFERHMRSRDEVQIFDINMELCTRGPFPWADGDELCKYIESILNGTAFQIKNVIFNDPATIVFWEDGTKTVVKVQDGDTFDPEKGLAMAYVKKTFGNKGNYCNAIKKWTEPWYEKHKNDDLIDDILHPDLIIPITLAKRVFNSIYGIRCDEEQKKDTKSDAHEKTPVKFRIVTTDYQHPDDVLDEYPDLGKFGFKDGYITFNTLEDLMRFKKCIGNPIIVFDEIYDNEPMIEIYDNYRE